MDISYQEGGGKFNYRVCAVMVHEGKLLAMRDERSPYYYLPGGRVKLGETAEMSEELGAAVRPVRPLWLNQGFFTEDVDQLRYHELCLYFLMDFAGTDLLARGQSFRRDEGVHSHQFTWLPFESLSDAYFYPIFLKKEIFHLPEGLTLRTEYE